MKNMMTAGTIFLKDDHEFIYKIAKITYTQWEDESFQYVFWPNYSVIDMLPPELFQGIPGLDLSRRKKSYVRKNVLPVFISERTPGENRQDLWQLLEAQGMAYLNRLEWLIKTDTVYSGDRLRVKAYEQSDEKQTIRISSLKGLGKRAAQMTRRMLEIICRGDDLDMGSFHIDDDTRGIYYPMLMAMYLQEKTYIMRRKDAGIKKAAARGLYQGRKPIHIDDTKLHEIFSAYRDKRLTADEGMDRLGVSRSTFFRRLKQWRVKEAESH